MIDDAGLENEVKNLNAMPLHLVSFVLSNSKRILNNFVHPISGFIQVMFLIQILIAYKLKINIAKN